MGETFWPHWLVVCVQAEAQLTIAARPLRLTCSEAVDLLGLRVRSNFPFWAENWLWFDNLLDGANLRIGAFFKGENVNDGKLQNFMFLCRYLNCN